MESGNSYTILINSHACTLSNDFFILPPKLTIAYAYSPLNEYVGTYILRNLSLMYHLNLRSNSYYEKLNQQIQQGQNPLNKPEIIHEEIVGNDDNAINNLRFNSTVPGDLKPSEENFPNEIVIIKNDTEDIFTDTIANNATLEDIWEQTKQLIKDPEANVSIYINAGRSLCLTISQLAESSTLVTEKQLIVNIASVFRPRNEDRFEIKKLPPSQQRATIDRFKITTLKALCIFCIQQNYIKVMPAGTQFCRTINERNPWGGKGLTFMNCNGRGNWNIVGSNLTQVAVV